MESEPSFNCGICCEGFDDEKRCPRLLSCGHSFCGGCLEKLIQAAVVTCPNCRKEAPVPSGVSGLAKNFALLDALLVAPQQDFATRVCNICSDEHNAQFACLDCKENFCQQASLWHTRTRFTTKHRVVSFEELEANPQLLQTSNICPEHDGEAFRFFDQDCGRVICRDCVALNHRTHNCSSLASAATKCREEIGAKVEQVVARAKQVEAAETHAAEVSRSLDENFEREAAKIRAALQEIRDVVNAREALLVQELTQHHKAKSVTLTNQRDLLHTSRACLESVVRRTQDAINSEDDVQLLVARSDLTSTLTALAAQPLAPEADDVLAFSVDPVEILATLADIGEVSDGSDPGPFTSKYEPEVVVCEQGAVASNPTRLPHSVFGWERLRTGRGLFHINEKVLLTPIAFGMLDFRMDPSLAGFNLPGSYGVGSGFTCCDGIRGRSDMKFLPGDDLQVELKHQGGSQTLLVTNLRSKTVASVEMPVGEYRLFVRLPPLTRVTWKDPSAPVN